LAPKTPDFLRILIKFPDQFDAENGSNAMREDSMVAPSRMVRAFSVSLVALGAVVMDGPDVAQALECRAAPPKQAKERWVYRTVEGKRCWMANSNASPDVKMVWSRESLEELQRVRNAQAKASDTAPTPLAMAPAAGQFPSPAASPAVEMQDDNSFEARWRRLGL
jgi:hypothetical protein